MKMQMQMKLISSLEKIFLDAEPMERPEDGILSGFRNEVISFQAAYMQQESASAYIDVEVVSPIGKWVRVRSVKHVPVRFAAFPDSTTIICARRPGCIPIFYRISSRMRCAPMPDNGIRCGLTWNPTKAPQPEFIRLKLC